MKCSYPSRPGATACLPLRASRWTAAGLCVSLAVGCGPSYSGSIGAILGKNNDDGRLYVREAPADMGAAKAGVEQGDEVTAIDGKEVSAMTPDEVHQALAGAVGTKVKLTIVRDGQTLRFDVQRVPLRK